MSVSTHNQALSAVLFLYREVMGVQLPWLDDVQRPTRPRRIASVLTSTEVAALFGAMTGVELLLAKLLYGAPLSNTPIWGQRWGWFWLFPAPKLSVDPRSRIERRHPLFEERLQRAIKLACAAAQIHKQASVDTLPGMGAVRRSPCACTSPAYVRYAVTSVRCIPKRRLTLCGVAANLSTPAQLL